MVPRDDLIQCFVNLLLLTHHKHFHKPGLTLTMDGAVDIVLLFYSISLF